MTTLCILQNLNVLQPANSKGTGQKQQSGFDKTLFSFLDSKVNLSQNDNVKTLNTDNLNMEELLALAYLINSGGQMITNQNQVNQVPGDQNQVNQILANQIPINQIPVNQVLVNQIQTNPTEANVQNIAQTSEKLTLNGLPLPPQVISNQGQVVNLQSANEDLQLKISSNESPIAENQTNLLNTNDKSDIVYSKFQQVCEAIKKQDGEKISDILMPQENTPFLKALQESPQNFLQSVKDVAVLADYISKNPDTEVAQKVKQLLEVIPQEEKNTIMVLAQKQPEIINEIQSIVMKTENKPENKSEIKKGKFEFSTANIKIGKHASTIRPDVQKVNVLSTPHTIAEHTDKKKLAVNIDTSQTKLAAEYKPSKGSDERIDDTKITNVFENALGKAAQKPLGFSDKATIAEKVTLDNISNDISQGLTSAIKDGKSEITVVLTPENLGKLYLKVSSDENGVTAHIITDNIRVKDEISRQSMALSDTLSGQGFKINTIEVQYKGNSDATDLFSGFNQQTKQQSGQHANHQGQEQNFQQYNQKANAKAAIKTMLLGMDQEAGFNYLA